MTVKTVLGPAVRVHLHGHTSPSPHTGNWYWLSPTITTTHGELLVSIKLPKITFSSLSLLILGVVKYPLPTPNIH